MESMVPATQKMVAAASTAVRATESMGSGSILPVIQHKFHSWKSGNRSFANLKLVSFWSSSPLASVSSPTGSGPTSEPAYPPPEISSTTPPPYLCLAIRVKYEVQAYLEYSAPYRLHLRGPEEKVDERIDTLTEKIHGRV